MNNWKKFHLYELGKIVGGATPSTKNPTYYGGDISWITPKDLSILKTRHIYKGENNITIAGLKSCAIKMLPAGSILFTSRAPIGYVAIAGQKLCTNQGFKSIIPNTDKVDSLFLYYLLKYNSIKLITFGAGTTFKEISGDTMKNISLYLPDDLKTQRCISSILDLIDRQIELNINFTNNLYTLIKTIYNYWFVQFDFPNDEGNPYKSSGGKIVWNDKLRRNIPCKWNVLTLKEVIKIIRGVAYQPSDISELNKKGTVALLKSNNIQNNQINFNSPVYINSNLVSEDQKLTKNSVFITMSSGSKAHMGKTAIVYRDLPYYYGAFCAKIEIHPLFNKYVSIYFLSNAFKSYIETNTSGTSINNISNKHLESILMPFPPENILRKFNKLCEPMFENIAYAQTQIDEYQKLSHFLLPLLMNGQVSFKD